MLPNGMFGNLSKVRMNPMTSQDSVLRQGTTLFFTTLLGIALCFGLNMAISYFLPTAFGFNLLLVSSIVIFCGLVWYYAKNRGERDAEPDLYKKERSLNPYRGLQMGLIAMVPYLLSLLLLILPMYGFSEDLIVIFKFINIQFMPILTFFLPLEGTQGLTWLPVLWAGALHLTIPATSAIAYVVGYNRYMDEIKEAMDSVKKK